MPAGGRNVNASMCTTRDRSNYLVKSRESSFSTLAQTPANVDHSRCMWYFFNPAAIELLRRPESPFLSLSTAHRERRVYFANIRGVRGHTATRQNDWSLGHSRALYFLPCCVQEELLSRKSFVEFGKWVAANLLFASAIDASPVSRASRGTI